MNTSCPSLNTISEGLSYSIIRNIFPETCFSVGAEGV